MSNQAVGDARAAGWARGVGAQPSVEPLAACVVRGLREQAAEESRSPCRIAPFQGLQGRRDVLCYIATADPRWSALNTARHRAGGGVSDWNSYGNRSRRRWSALAGSLRRRLRFPPPPLDVARPRPPSGEPGFSFSAEAASAILHLHHQIALLPRCRRPPAARCARRTPGKVSGEGVRHFVRPTRCSANRLTPS